MKQYISSRSWIDETILW